MLDPPDQFRTGRLLLRAPAIEDARDIFERYATDTEVSRYLTWEPHQSEETVREFLADVIARRAAGREWSWVLTLPGENRCIGMIAARAKRHMANIGYVLERRHWNRGYMTEAICAVSDWLLSRPGLFRVWAVCDTANIGSARALEKSGFRREGVLRRWIVHPGCSDEPRDCYVYGRVR